MRSIWSSWVFIIIGAAGVVMTEALRHLERRLAQWKVP